MICDFCLNKPADLKKSYSCKAFSLGPLMGTPVVGGGVFRGNNAMSKTVWDACKDCAPFVDQNDYEGLLNDIEKHRLPVIGPSDWQLHENKVRQFFANKT